MRIRTAMAGVLLVMGGLACYEEPQPGRPSAEPPAPPPEPPPKVSEMQPGDGPWGTAVTITGTDLKGDDALLLLGPKGELEVQPSDKVVTSWDDTAIEFRFPFPMEGAISIETAHGSDFVGEFTPTWSAGPAFDINFIGVLSSVSARAGQVTLALDTTPPKLVDIEATGVTERPIQVSKINPLTLRLYVLGEETHGFALSTAAPPEIIHLAPDGAGLKGVATGIATSGEVALAGGVGGGVVWFREGDAWTRARHGQSGWSIDKGPIADPNPGGKLHAAGATSDGSLFIAWEEPTGSFFDDMGAPFMQQLAPDASEFSGPMQAGRSLDDYLTDLRLEGRGSGLVIHYCGSDVDPFGATDTEYSCVSSARGGDGEIRDSYLPEGDDARWAFTATSATLAYCDPLGSEELLFTSDPFKDAGEAAIWPCPSLRGFEVDGDGNLLPIVQKGIDSFSPRKREDAMGGSGGAGGSGGSGGGGGGSGGEGGGGGGSGGEGGSGNGGSGGSGGSAPVSNCCQEHAGAGCDTPSVEDCVCQANLACCLLNWSASCVSAVEANGCGMCP